MDWNDNGHEDYEDGLLDGLFWFGPWQVSLVMALVFVVWMIYRHT